MHYRWPAGIANWRWRGRQPLDAHGLARFGMSRDLLAPPRCPDAPNVEYHLH